MSAGGPIPLPIGTERLVVRTFLVDADTEPMLAVYADPEVMRFVPGGALPGREAVASALLAHAESQRRRGFAFWAVVEREGARVVGDVGFGILEPTGDLELGYTFARDRWGRGYAAEAAGACVDAAFRHLDVPRIVAVVDEANVRSLRVAERIGMAPIDAIDRHGRPHVLLAVDRSTRSAAAARP